MSGSRNARMFVSTHAVLNYVWDGSTWVAETQPGASTATSSTQVSITGTTIDSSGALLVNPGAAGSTTDKLSSVAGRVLVDQNSTVWRVQQGGYVAPTTIVTVSTGHITVDTGSISVSNFSTTVQVSSLAGVVNVQQNSTVWQVQQGGYVAPSTDARVSPLAGSTWMVRPLQSSAADLQMTATPVAGSTWNVRPLQSSQADLRATIYQSTYTDLSVQAVNVGLDSSASVQIMRMSVGTPASTAYGLVVQPAAGSTVATRPLQSSASDLKVSAFLFDSTGNAIESSTFAASSKTSTARGIVTRPAIPQCTSIGVRLATAGDNTLLTSAVTSIYVYAVGFSAGLASTGPSTGSSAANMRFQDGTTSASLWSFQYSLSSLGADQNAIAVSPPAYLFRTSPSNLLNVSATSTGVYVSVAAWRE